jgi:hypothetical protein
MQMAIEQHEKELRNCVPLYYQELFAEVERALREEKLQEGEQAHQLLVEEWREKSDELQWEQKGMLKKWLQFRTAESLALANAKYHEHSYLQLHTEPSR